MSLTVFEDIQYEPWGGYTDPRLPTRVWKGRVLATGDASGGDISAFLRFNLAGVERLDSFFSLEEMYMDLSINATIIILFETRNFGSIKTGIRPVSMAVNNANTTGTRSGMSVNGKQFLPAFLGQQITKSTLMEIIWQYDNVLGDTGAFWAGGYVWGPRSASALNGGIVRPDRGVFPQ